MKYIVKLSFLNNENETAYSYVEYIVSAKNLNSAKNKAIIQLIKNHDPYYFHWNEAHEITPSFYHQSETPLI